MLTTFKGGNLSYLLCIVFCIKSMDTCEALTAELMQTKKRLVETEEEKQRLELEAQQVSFISCITLCPISKDECLFVAGTCIVLSAFFSLALLTLYQMKNYIRLVQFDSICRRQM